MTIDEAIKFAEYAQIMAMDKPEVQEFYKLAEAALRAQQEQQKNEPLTNADRIRAMNDEELAKWLCDDIIDCCVCQHLVGLDDCGGKRRLLDWLQQPAGGVT